MLLGTYIHLLANDSVRRLSAKPPIAVLNAGAEALDRRAPSLREPQPGALFANYHVVAEVA